MLPLGAAHHSSPGVPSAGEIGSPFHGGSGCAVAGAEVPIAATNTASETAIRIEILPDRLVAVSTGGHLLR
jgi:hypothetical protein